MIRHCETCEVMYDDAKRLTYCPHEAYLEARTRHQDHMRTSRFGNMNYTGLSNPAKEIR